jgi:hypothetical protein
MSNEQRAVVTDRLDVSVATAPAHSMAGIRTDLMIERWDAEQTAWALARSRVARDLPWYWEPGKADFAALGVAPYRVTVDEDCNNVIQGGWLALISGISASGTAPTHVFDSTHARIGVGTSSAAIAWTQTTLQGDTGSGSTTSYFKLVSGSPTVSTGSSPASIVFSSAFGSGVANFAWQEFGTDAGTADSVSNATTGGTFFNRGLSSQGTKTSGQTWTATETISFGYPSGSGTVS